MPANPKPGESRASPRGPVQQQGLAEHLYVVAVALEPKGVNPIASSRNKSIEELYRVHAPEARRLAYLLTGNEEVADDVSQDAFVRVIGRLGHLRNESAFGPYLRRTIVNLSRMRFRRRKVEARYIERHERARDVTHVDVDVSEVEALRVSLLTLPYRQRAAIVLRFYGDLADEDIADILGCAVGTVRSLVSRGLSSLRSEMRADRRG